MSDNLFSNTSLHKEQTRAKIFTNSVFGRNMYIISFMALNGQGCDINNHNFVISNLLLRHFKDTSYQRRRIKLANALRICPNNRLLLLWRETGNPRGNFFPTSINWIGNTGERVYIQITETDDSINRII